MDAARRPEPAVYGRGHPSGSNGEVRISVELVGSPVTLPESTKVRSRTIACQIGKNRKMRIVAAGIF
jgi:hypothetical protein